MMGKKSKATIDYLVKPFPRTNNMFRNVSCLNTNAFEVCIVAFLAKTLCIHTIHRGAYTRSLSILRLLFLLQGIYS